IAEFRKGCSALIFAPHRPLSPDDRKWLVERCRAWAEKVDKHLTALEAGGEPIRVRAEMDATVKTLIEKLRERAQAAGRGAAAASTAPSRAPGTPGAGRVRPSSLPATAGRTCPPPSAAGLRRPTC